MTAVARPQLLVSVRNATEAEAAVRGGADIVDVKEPARGPMGMADESVIAEIVRTVAGRRPVTAALGDLRDWPIESVLPEAEVQQLHDDPGCSFRRRSIPRVDFVKIGLAGSGGTSGWRRALANLIERSGLPERSWVLVAYADHQSAGAPEPREVAECCAALELGGLLVDTFDKSKGGLFDHLTPDELRSLSLECACGDRFLALAGRLTSTDLAPLLDLHPDIIGVRSAACTSGDRTGTIDADRVAKLAGLIAGHSVR